MVTSAFAAAQEACVTRAGTVVGPLLTDLVGFPELTPHRYGWAGNEISAEAFTQLQRNTARQFSELIGSSLWQEGYRGYFQVDYLIDLDTGIIVHYANF